MSSVPCSKSICLPAISPCVSRRDTNRTPLVDQGESILAGEFDLCGMPCARNHTRCIGKMLLEITNPFGASAQE